MGRNRMNEIQKIGNGKKIVIYGSGRYPRDFLYVFDSIEVSYYVDDEAHDDTKSYEVLHEEQDTVFVILCKYDEKNARENLDSIGFRKGIDYVSAASLFHKLDFPIKEISEQRSVYIYGTGDVSHRFFHEFVEKNPEVEIVGCVDKDPLKRGKTFFRRPIYMPEEILKEEDSFFIVASTLYYQEIKENLLGYGKKEGTDFVSCHAVNSWASWMMRETVYDVPRLDYVCPKPFQDAALMGEGRLSVCAGVKNMTNWNIPVFYACFGQVWHSNVMKVLRLSVVNGTYTFCDENKCDLKGNCGNRVIDTDELHYSFHRTKNQLEVIARMGAFPKDYVIRESNYERKENEYPDVVMCSFDRSCNLHCPSCRRERYIADRTQEKILQDFAERMEKELLPHVKRLKVAGDGEAFVSRVYRDIIYRERLPKTIEQIGILSNGTLFTPENLDRLIEKYNSVKVFISMDGYTKETAEKLRAGADFERWKENMRYLGRKRQEGKVDFLAFNFVVQRDNYLEMPDYVKMCLGFHADGIKFSRLKRPDGYTEEEYERIDMFDSDGNMKPELMETVQDKIFESPEVHLFTWIDW